MITTILYPMDELAKIDCTIQSTYRQEIVDYTSSLFHNRLTTDKGTEYHG